MREEMKAIFDFFFHTGRCRRCKIVSELCRYYRRFISCFGKVALDLTELLKQGKSFKWTDTEQRSYDRLKALIQTASMLRTVDVTKPFILSTDASGFAVGAVLSQPSDDNAVLRPIAFYSVKLKDAERRYPTHEREMLAIVKALTFFRCDIHRYSITVLTDHRTLQFFQDQDKYSYRQVRWNEFMQQFKTSKRAGKHYIMLN